MDNSVPVVVIKDKGGHGALAIARSLGRLGVQTYLITKKKDAIASSRYWVKSFVWDFSAPRDQSLSFLLDVGRQIGTRAILLTIWDSGALFIENNTSALEKAFIFPKPAPGVIALLSNKWQMYLAAKKHGIPTPHVVFPQSRDEVTRFALTATFPIMMKGADQSLSQAKFKEVVHNSHDLIEQYDRAHASGPANLILQEYIPGDESTVWMCNAYFDGKSQCRAVLTGKKLRQESPVGIATLAVCLPNATVEAETRDFMQAVGYAGAVGIGYRYDARDGLYKVLDVNARVSGVFRLFRATNGMDVVRACYLDLTGQPVPQLALANGRKWLLEEDVFAAVRQAREGNLTFKQWLESLRGVQELHWFAADDPMPFMQWAWPRLRGVVRHLIGSAGRGILAPWKRKTGRRRVDPVAGFSKPDSRATVEEKVPTISIPE